MPSLAEDIPGPLLAITRLRETAARIAALDDGGGPVEAWFITLVQEYDAGARHGCRLDELAGLIPAAGRDPRSAVRHRFSRAGIA
jgi:hypothetical protein